MSCNRRLGIQALIHPSIYRPTRAGGAKLRRGVRGAPGRCYPFMGGGTTLFEANRLGLSTNGYDTNPMSRWIGS